MRLLHTADWHLGKSVFGVNMLEDQAYLLDQILNLVRDLKPQYLIITGDLFDHPSPTPEAVNLMEQTISRLILQLNCKVVWVRGQHDRPDRLALNSPLLHERGFHLVLNHRQALSPLELEGPTGPVRFWFLPFLETRPLRNFLNEPELRDPIRATEGFLRHLLREITFSGINCLFGYGCFGESDPANYGFAKTGSIPTDLLQGFDYVGLGYDHQPQTIGHQRQRYAGSILRYSAKEIGQRKSLVMIDLEGPGQVNVETFPLSPRHELRRLEGPVDELLAGSLSVGGRHDYVVLKFTDREPRVDEYRVLQEVYPNLVHLETPEPELEYLEDLSLESLFTAFYEEVTDRDLELEQRVFVQEMLAD